MNQPEVAASLSATAIGRQIVTSLPQANGDDPDNHADSSLQSRSEGGITGAPERCCRMQTARAKARGQLEVHAIYLRNRVFDIAAQTVRPIIAEAYAQNMSAGTLEQMLDTAHSTGTRVITYIPPLRQDYSPPYDMVQYRFFKQETRDLWNAMAPHGSTSMTWYRPISGEPRPPHALVATWNSI